MKFSIIIPIYNCEHYLRECLDSVKAQSYDDWECICVDDGSTDSSGHIADAYAANDSRFRVIHKPNGGEGSARNAGLNVFEGEWVYFLDSDDVLNSKTLEFCAIGIEKHPNTDLSSVEMIPFADGHSPGWNVQEPSWNVFDITNSIDKKTFGISVWSVAYRSDLVKQIKFSNLKIGADRVFVIQAIEKAHLHVHCNYIGYGYRIRSGSLVNTPMNDIKFLADLRHRVFVGNMIKNSKKMYELSICTRFTKELIEYMASCFFDMPKVQQKNCVNEYAQSMLKFLGIPGLNPWKRFVLWTCGKTKSRFLIWIMCYFSYWLKIHGVNRKFAVLKERDIK